MSADLNTQAYSWCWWRIGDMGDHTYVKDTYHSFTNILPQFKDVRTLEDLKELDKSMQDDDYKKAQEELVRDLTAVFGPNADIAALMRVSSFSDCNLMQLTKYFNSPTGCYFEIKGDENDEVCGRFYHDSEGCIEWGLDENGRVYAYDGEYPIIVAASLPEFLSRMYIENTEWAAKAAAAEKA